ncbi:MAG TPA: ChbG/HpnK family deacetylase [Acidobacteriota bacterium]
MKRAILNADDFGLSPGVNRGILTAFRDGILTSTTMLVNLEHFEDAVALARQNPDLPVGIHLSLLWGRPLSEPAAVPSLVERDGAFPTRFAVLARRYVTGRLSLDQVRSEFRLQVRKFLDTGLTPTHVDTHKHVHCLPGVLEALAQVAAEFQIHKVRLPLDNGLAAKARRLGLSGLDAPWRDAFDRQMIRLLCRRGRARLQAYRLRTTDHFVGIEYSRALSPEVLAFILQNLESGVTEVMCHPGYDDPPAQRFSHAPPDRGQQLRALTAAAARQAARDGGVQLVSFQEL